MSTYKRCPHCGKEIKDKNVESSFCDGCKHDGNQGLYCSPCQNGCKDGSNFEPK